MGLRGFVKNETMEYIDIHTNKAEINKYPMCKNYKGYRMHHSDAQFWIEHSIALVFWCMRLRKCFLRLVLGDCR